MTNQQDRLEFTLGMLCRTYGTLYMEAIFTPGSKPVVMIVSSRWDYEGDDNLCDALCLRHSMRNEVSPVRTKHK